jgi:hypothetical protein
VGEGAQRADVVLKIYCKKYSYCMRRQYIILVPLAGIEPALFSELDFESSASTNSATRAFAEQITQANAILLI